MGLVPPCAIESMTLRGEESLTHMNVEVELDPLNAANRPKSSLTSCPTMLGQDTHA